MPSLAARIQNFFGVIPYEARHFIFRGWLPGFDVARGACEGDVEMYDDEIRAGRMGTPHPSGVLDISVVTPIAPSATSREHSTPVGAELRVLIAPSLVGDNVVADYLRAIGIDAEPKPVSPRSRRSLCVRVLGSLSGIFFVCAAVAVLALMVPPPNFMDICGGPVCEGQKIDQLRDAWNDWRLAAYPGVLGLAVFAGFVCLSVRRKFSLPPVFNAVVLGMAIGVALVAQGTFTHFIVPFSTPRIVYQGNGRAGLGMRLGWGFVSCCCCEDGFAGVEGVSRGNVGRKYC